MPKLITLPTKKDNRGSLTIIEKILPKDIKRSFFIYNVKKGEIRGGHRHKENYMALICVTGSCLIKNHNGLTRSSFLLDSPEKCLILEPRDWHTMEEFTPDAVLMVYATEYYDSNDYITEEYE
jgi:dTDP-4-dehydrorhamnose 3,5-epimerase-like enzyme